MKYLLMKDLDLADATVMIREDFNVPLENGRVSSDARIKAALPTIRLAREKGAKIILLSHLGRPVEGQSDSKFSLEPVARHLSELLEHPVRFERDWLEGVSIGDDEIVMCENVRFNSGEKSNDEQLSRRMGRLCDVFVMDAFGSSHRAHASTEGVAKYAPLACAGPLLDRELRTLNECLENPTRPTLAIVGGSKVSTKLTVLDALLDTVDELIVGGGIANTFIAAAGHEIGQSLSEPELVHEAQRLIRKAHQRGGSIPIPRDVVVAASFSADAQPHVRPVDGVGHDEMILDIGPLTTAEYSEIIAGAGTVIWNGPVGVFEFPAFAAGTRAVAEATGRSAAYSVAGGGDTLAAIDAFGVADEIDYISTGGGAFLELVEGKRLPAVAVLAAYV
jgi:phosphoglycerate kinase